jgi:hypothetical protein
MVIDVLVAIDKNRIGRRRVLRLTNVIIAKYMINGYVRLSAGRRKNENFSEALIAIGSSVYPFPYFTLRSLLNNRKAEEGETSISISFVLVIIAQGRVLR